MKARAVTVRDLVEDPALDLAVTAGHSGLDRMVQGSRIQKSGLALAGHFHGIDSARIQILGVTEMTYLNRLAPAVCVESTRHFFERELCCVVITESPLDSGSTGPSHAHDALVEAADATNTPLLLSTERSSRTITAIHALLDARLAPRKRVHGVLVDVFEVGLLLLGSSGVGKSEVALELVMRGHRLVADDVVDCEYRPPGMVFGAPADRLRHHLEVRGLGILNVKDLFGVTAIRGRKRIDVVVQLVDSPQDAEHGRLGLDERHHTLLGVRVPELSVPVRPGRDMASIMEIAARNELLKLAGHHPARDFLAQIEHGASRRNDQPESQAHGDLAAGASERRLELPPAARSPLPSSAPPESSVGFPFVRKNE